MAYEKQNFYDGQVLTAEHLNRIEDGITEEVYIGSDTPTDENIKLWVNPDEESDDTVNWEDIQDKPTIPSDDHINSLIDTKLGVIENGTY